MTAWLAAATKGQRLAVENAGDDNEKEKEVSGLFSFYLRWHPFAHTILLSAESHHSSSSKKPANVKETKPTKKKASAPQEKPVSKKHQHCE